MSYLNGIAVSPTLFNLSLNLAIRSSWSEPQSIPGLVFADYIELLHLSISISIYLYIVLLLRYIWKQTGLKYKVENVMSSNLENSTTDVIFTLNVQFTLSSRLEIHQCPPSILWNPSTTNWKQLISPSLTPESSFPALWHMIHKKAFLPTLPIK